MDGDISMGEESLGCSKIEAERVVDTRVLHHRRRDVGLFVLAVVIGFYCHFWLASFFLRMNTDGYM